MLSAVGVGPWAKSLVRQGLMVAGKSGSLIRSWYQKNNLMQKLSEEYSVSNYNALQTAEGYLRQDKVALGAVIGGALLGNAIRLNAENGVDISSLDNKLSELASKVKENVNVNEESTQSIVPEAEIVPQPAPEAEIAPQPAPEAEVAPQPAPEAEVAPQPLPEGENDKLISLNDLDNDHKKMFLNSHKKWENTNINKYIGRFEKEGYHVSGDFKGAEKGIVQEFYKAIQAGQVESCPEGMSPVEYVDKLTRLMQLAPGEQRKGIELMLRDLLCKDYVPTDADKQTIAETLNTIRYDKGTSQCVMFDENGNPCVKSMPNFGNYFGQRKVADVVLENGEKVTLPIRNANVTVAIGAEVDCEGGSGKIASSHSGASTGSQNCS